jgi:hypothetical protein
MGMNRSVWIKFYTLICILFYLSVSFFALDIHTGYSEDVYPFQSMEMSSIFTADTYDTRDSVYHFDVDFITSEEISSSVLAPLPAAHQLVSLFQSQRSLLLAEVLLFSIISIYSAYKLLFNGYKRTYFVSQTRFFLDIHAERLTC